MRDEARFLDRIERLGVMNQKGMRAPHKPLLLLLALGRVLAGHERLEFYAVLENPLKRLLVLYGPPRKRLRPEAPFGWLRTDDLWDIPDDGRLSVNSWGTLNRSGLIRHAAQGGFPEDIFRLLRRDPDLVRRAAQLLLDRHFPRSLHERILASVNIPADPAARWVRTTERSRAFRKEVLLAYESRCAVCGYDLRMNDEVIGLDAAHIKWHSQNGPDIVPNGLALCALHHEALDRGALGLRSMQEPGRFAVIVSDVVDTRNETGRLFLQLQDGLLRSPASVELAPRPAFVAWHGREVFRGQLAVSSG